MTLPPPRPPTMPPKVTRSIGLGCAFMILAAFVILGGAFVWWMLTVLL